MAFDEESKNYLDDVKKGKPRRFVMICKGVKIVSLIVYKKGSVEKYKKQAKEEGNGQVYYGVISGKGVEVVFNLLRSDGFDKPPGKDLTLKDFLKTEGDLKFKPTYAIVDVLPEVPLDEEVLQDPLIAKFRMMEPEINRAREVHPASIPLIEMKVKLIEGLLHDEETRASAASPMDELVQYLKELFSANATATQSPQVAPTQNDHNAPTDSKTPSPPSETDAESALVAKLAEVLKRLKPLMDSVIKADPNRKGELQATMVQIAGEIKQRQLDQAKQNITDFATLLKALAAQQAVANVGAPVDRMVEFTEHHTAMEPRLREAQNADGTKAAKLGAVWDYAKVQAEARDFAKAFKALDGLKAALDQVLATTKAGLSNDAPVTPPSESNTFDPAIYTNASSMWRDARRTMQSEMSKLEAAILAALSPDPRLDEIARDVPDLSDRLQVFDTGLEESLDAIGKAEDSAERDSLLKEALAQLREGMAALDDSFFREVDDGNGFTNVAVAATARKSLESIAKIVG